MLQPLEFDNDAVSVLCKAFDSKTPVSTLVSKAFNTVESCYSLTTPSLLPPQRLFTDTTLGQIACATV
jgi:hypothetical protein